jgi:hypothetical protein
VGKRSRLIAGCDTARSREAPLTDPGGQISMLREHRIAAIVSVVPLRASDPR